MLFNKVIKKQKGFWLATFIIICMLTQLFASFGVLAQDRASEFADIEGHWANKTLAEMVNAGVLNGVSENGKLLIQPDKQKTCRNASSAQPKRVHP